MADSNIAGRVKNVTQGIASFLCISNLSKRIYIQYIATFTNDMLRPALFSILVFVNVYACVVCVYGSTIPNEQFSSF